MSAIASTVLPDKIIMLSDGRVTNRGEALGMDFPKVYKVNRSWGFFWMGNYPRLDSLQRIQTHLQSYAGDNIAGEASQYLRELYTPILPSFTKENRHRFIFILHGTRQWHGWDSDHDDPFEPVTRPVGGVGTSLFWAYRPQDNDGKRYNNKIQPLINRGVPPAQACKQGFKARLQEMAANGRKVGGTVFTETIHPQKISRFQQALRS